MKPYFLDPKTYGANRPGLERIGQIIDLEITEFVVGDKAISGMTLAKLLGLLDEPPTSSAPVSGCGSASV